MNTNHQKSRSAFALALALLLLPAAVACGSKKKSAVATATSAPIARATPSPTPQDLLNTATKNTEVLKAFHFTLTHENGSTPVAQGISMSKADGDFVQPDRMKATISGTVAQGFDIDAKVISVGNNVWIALIGNRYLPLPNGVGAASILDPNNGVLKALHGVKSPQFAGTEKVNGVDATVVSGTIDAGDLTALDADAQAGKSVKGKVWIGNTDQRVYRLRLDGPLNDQEPANIARILDLSQFNESVTIQPPA